MKVLARLLLFLLCLKVFSPLQAQSAYFQLNKPYYFHGEHIFYTLFLGEIKTDSAVLHFRLVKDGEILQQHYHAYDQGYISGYFKLDHELSSGVCEIHAFAFDKENGAPIDLLNAPISVFGSDISSQKPNKYISSKPLYSEVSNSGIELEFTPKEAQKDDFSYCRIKGLTAENGQLSVNFRKLAVGSNSSPTVRYFEHELHLTECADQLSILGHKTSSDSLLSQSALVYAFQPDSLLFHLASADPSGTVNFAFPRFYGTNELQFLDFFLSRPLTIELFPISEAKKPAITYIQDTTIATEYALLQKRRQIYQLFNRLPYRLRPARIGEGQIIREADFEVDVQDYAVKGKLEDLFSEFVSPLNFRKSKKGNPIRVYYRFKGKPVYHKYPPLFIVNGLATQNADYINTLLLQEVKSISIYNEPKSLQAIVGSYHIGGLIVIELMDPLFHLPDEIALPRLEVTGLQRPISYPIIGESNPEVPRIQSQLYWAPHRLPKAENEFQLTFPTSDLPGTYAMDLLIQDAQGKIYVESIRLSYDGNDWHRIAN